MIFDFNNPQHFGIRIFDYTGNKIKCVSKYNTDTKEITMTLPAGCGDIQTICILENEKIFPKKISFILEGSYAQDKNGKKIE